MRITIVTLRADGSRITSGFPRVGETLDTQIFDELFFTLTKSNKMHTPH